MAFIDVVRFDGLKNRDWVIYKYPSEELKLGTQLIVQEGQVAIFVKSGVVADIFYAGTYTLKAANLPVLNSIVKLPFGGNTPFSAEVYFLNVTTRMDISWGTTDPIQLVDPKYYVRLRIRAFGQMGVRIFDPTVLFRDLIGGMQKSDIIKYDKIKEYYRGILVIKAKSAIADAIITNKISALEISTKLEELSERVKEQISPEFEKHGLVVSNFYIQSINFPDEDFEKINKILEDKAAFEIMGDNRYATKRSFDVYEGAATNENGVAGVFAAGGLGFGAAANLGGAVAQNVRPPFSQENMKSCPNCNKSIAASSNFCPECGYRYMAATCDCGQPLVADMRFCPKCGKKVD